jgi:mannose-6-phosphate isomerase-like protein (cupin superfamily)
MGTPLELTTNNRAEVFEAVRKYLRGLHLTIINEDTSRPWGGFFVLDESQAGEFAAQFFPTIAVDSLRISGKLSPKILMVEPGKRLSWQYHHRRAEIWRTIGGTVAVATSMTDVESERTQVGVGETIRLAQGQRHRLIGLDGWGVVAEIWQHTDAQKPSDESDIIRLQDDFGR